MKEIFSLTQRQAYKAIDDLIEESQPNGAYIALLILSSIIITSGLLLNNVSVLIGGMLITPLLTPLLVVALSITTSKYYLLKRTGKVLLKSFVFVFLTTFLVSLILGLPDNVQQQQQILESSPRIAFLYALVAISSGVAATLAWIRKEINSALPGVSIAVSLVPPLAAVGMWLSRGHFTEAKFFGLVFLINVSMVVLGSVLVFLILHLNDTFTVLDKKEQELKKEDKQKEEVKKLAQEIKILEREAIFEEEVDPDLHINLEANEIEK